VLMLTASRPVFACFLKWLVAAGYTSRRIAVVADGASRERLLQSLRGLSGVSVVGVFAQSGRERQPTYDGTITALSAIGQRDEIDEVVIAQSEAPQQHTARLVDELSVLPIDVWLCPVDFGMPILATARLGALSLLHVQPKPIRDWGYVVKAMFD